MKNLFFCFCIVSLLLLGCATTQKVNCPPKDTIIFVPTPVGLLAVGISKGHLNKENEGESWMSAEDYDALEAEQDTENPAGI